MKARKTLGAILVVVCLAFSGVAAAGELTEPTEETQTEAPTEKPSEDPTEEPNEEPTEESSEEPTEKPTEEPSEKPTEEPSEEPTEEQSEKPTDEPTEESTEKPTEEPSEEPTEEPSEEPSAEPTEKSERREYDDNEVFSVTVPAELPFVIDPFMAAGRGEIYSDRFDIRNNGEWPIIVVFDDLYYEMNSGGGKAVEMYLRHNDPALDFEITEAPGECAEYELLPGQNMEFWISGTVNDYNLEWEDGDVSLYLRYTTTALIVEEAEIL